MITIKFRNGPSNIVTWTEDSYDDYMYDKSYFIIMDHGQWIGFYNLDCIESIVIDSAWKENGKCDLKR